MKRAVTLVELLVVLAIISLLMALGLPVMRVVREQAGETVCRSNLRQLGMALKTYVNDNDGVFPNSSLLYHAAESFDPKGPWKAYLACCRWHDARIGFDSDLLRSEHPELRGSLWPYLGNHEIVRCKVGRLANERRGCSNACEWCVHDPRIPIVPQYTYTMNSYLSRDACTGTSASGLFRDSIDSRTVRLTQIHKETHVTRSHSEVFAFGEENSWAINTEGRQPLGVRREWAAEYNLSGKYYLGEIPPGHHGTLGWSALDIACTYGLDGTSLVQDPKVIGDAFATCHRPRKGDLNTGHSYVVLLDGHVERVTVADQLRKSRRVPHLPASRLGPGGNLALAWPVDISPLGGWENQ